MVGGFSPDISQPLRENDTVILMIPNKGGFTVRIERGRTIRICKDTVKLDMLIGCSYGDVYTKDSVDWIRITRNDPRYQQYHSRIRDAQPEEAIPNAPDNRNIQDTNTAQKLSYDEIQRLKKEKKVHELIETIVDNSTTFLQKTKMAQEKYIRRKEDKHLKLFYVRPCDLYNICNCYFNSFPHKIGYLNFANLGMMLYLADIRHGHKVMIFDHSLGLLTGAVSQRLAGSGKIYRLVTKGVSDKIVHELGITYLDNIVSIELEEYLGNQEAIGGVTAVNRSEKQSTIHYHLHSTDGMSAVRDDAIEIEYAEEPSADRVGWHVPNGRFKLNSCDEKFAVERSKQQLRDEGVTVRDESMDLKQPKKQATTGIYPIYHPSIEEVCNCHVIIGNISYNKCDKLNRVVSQYTSKLKFAADKYLELGGRLVVFGQQYQPMAALQSSLSRSDNYVNVKFDELFIREYQMIRLRTHPLMRSDVRPFCGFIVSATKASSDII